MAADSRTRFSETVISLMRRDIEEADGNEVFWACRINESGIIVEAKAGSRGNEDSVIVNQNAAREGHVLVHNHPSGILKPSEADQSVAYNATDTSLGFYIVNNDVSQVYVVVEPVKPKVLEKLDCDEAASYLSAGGALSKQSDTYEERPSQIQLVRQIASSFNENKISVFEAGTGVGKSFAYLLPSVLWALKNKERVVVSTGTINLQQQLFEKDIPFVQKILGKKIKSVLLKGRQNYLCLRRLQDAESERDLFNENTEIFDKIYEWSKTSSTGSRSDLSFMPPDSVWTKVNSESDGCMGGRCPHREECFVMRVRREASDANIIVVNHHLLFADIESRMSGAGYEDTAVLPPYRRVVFDEAHGIEDSATSFFSEIITRFKVMKQVSLLFRSWKGSAAGFLMQCAVLSKVENVHERAMGMTSEIRDCLFLLDEISIRILSEDTGSRIYQGNKGRFDETLEAMNRLRAAIVKFDDLVREVLEGIDEDDLDVPSVWETKTVLHRLEDIAGLCNTFLHWDENEETVFWLQRVKVPAKNPGEEPLQFVQYIQTPLDIAPMMNSGVFEQMSTVVCTSATLKTSGSFGFWTRRTGISFADQERVSEMSFESPFPYKENVIFAVPNDAPFPDSQFYQQYIEDAIPRLIESAGGRTLVLFTSYDSLRYTYNAARRALSDKPYSIFKQGDDDRFKLLEKFKEETGSVLFATDSFWEGVDVPGSSLSQVIIVKLPFAVPNDPVFAARSEDLEKKGGNAFMQLSVPQAVIKFRQGFGRLVRRGSDRGAVVVLDRRIVEKRYGKMFTSSVPMTRRLYCPLEEIMKSVKEFVE